MSIINIHLRKLLKILYLPEGKRNSALRSDIREEIAKQDGFASGGGDFYAPFWFDAKSHVFNRSDLTTKTAERIRANDRRSNLYPQLRDGFLSWWVDKRRWTNEPFQEAPPVKGRMVLSDLGATIKIDSVLSATDGSGETHHVYPYFSYDPVLNDEASRVGLWILINSLSDIDTSEVRILDVIRGRTFAADQIDLLGDEESILRSKYRSVINDWRRLWDEYD